MQDYKKRKYTLEKYNSQWVLQFSIEAAKLRQVFGEKARAIHHIGSTAVPGLSGKPTIDILVLIDDLSEVENFESPMQKLGYTNLGEYVTSDSRLFAKEKNNTRLYNTHVFEEKHPDVQEMLQLRDYLRVHHQEMEAYSKLKEKLYAKYPTDYASYRKTKDEYMDNLKARILR